MTSAKTAREFVIDYQKALDLEYDREAEEIANDIYKKYIEPKAKDGQQCVFIEINANKEIGIRLIKIIADAGYSWQTTSNSLRGWLFW